LAQNTSTKCRAVTIHPPARLVGEPKKTKKERKEGRKEGKKKDTQTVANWQIGQGVTALWGSKMALPYYFGQWLIQQFVLPYKPWCCLFTSSLVSLVCKQCATPASGCHNVSRSVTLGTKIFDLSLSFRSRKSTTTYVGFDDDLEYNL